jgi:hypothetical protein
LWGQSSHAWQQRTGECDVATAGWVGGVRSVVRGVEATSNSCAV